MKLEEAVEIVRKVELVEVELWQGGRDTEEGGSDGVGGGGNGGGGVGGS